MPSGRAGLPTRLQAVHAADAAAGEGIALRVPRCRPTRRIVRWLSLPHAVRRAQVREDAVELLRFHLHPWIVGAGAVVPRPAAAPAADEPAAGGAGASSEAAAPAAGGGRKGHTKPDTGTRTSPPDAGAGGGVTGAAEGKVEAVTMRLAVWA